LPQAIVKIDTIEEVDEEQSNRIRHDVRCDWGTLDGYAPRFRRGKISKYTLTGTEVIGSLSIRVSPHRPLVGKDFLAFQ
jgi:hypothetical protein